MSLGRILVTGDRFFLSRHRLLVDALGRLGPHVDILARQERTPSQRLEISLAGASFAIRYLMKRSLPARERFDPRQIRRTFAKSSAAFTIGSRQLAVNVARRRPRPDLVLHVFSMSSPASKFAGVPVAHYLDFTRALARRGDWDEVPAAFAHDAGAWLTAERDCYQRAVRLFTMSELVRRSLVEDYGVDPGKVIVVGSGGNLDIPLDEPKAFGSLRLLFNASEFERKGGRLVFGAWPLIRRALPAAILVTVGKALPRRFDQVEDRGRVSALTLRELLRTTDLVLAPSLTDPFPGFVIEAMAAGVPSIVSDRDGMPEIVTDGVNGVVLSELTPRGLAAAAIALLNDAERLAAFSVAGRRTVRERLNWDVVAHSMLESLAEIGS